MYQFNKSVIFTTAWKFVKAGRAENIGDGLTKAWYNAKEVKAVNANGEVHTWGEWHDLGREVVHGSKCIAQAKLWDAKTKNGTRIHSFFTYEQTCLLGEQD